MDNNTKSTRDLLLENKALLENGVISKEEYEEKKTELLEKAGELKRKKTASNLAVWTAGAIIILVGGCIIYTILYNAFKPRPDYDNYFSAISTYLNTVEAITYYEAEESRVELYVDSNIWSASSNQEKAEFCYMINKALSEYCVFYHIDEYMASVYYYTESGVKVAEPKAMSLESEILY